MQYQEPVMDNFFTELILSEDHPQDYDEPYNFINHLCGSHILYKKNDVISRVKNNFTKQIIFRELIIQITGDKSFELKLYFKTRWVLAIDTLYQLLKLKNIIMNPLFTTNLRVEFTEDEFTRIVNLLLFLEPFSVLCVLLSSGNCAINYTIPLIYKYEAIISDVMKHQFSKEPSCARTYMLLKKFSKKMLKYLNYYYNNDC